MFTVVHLVIVRHDPWPSMTFRGHLKAMKRAVHSSNSWASCQAGADVCTLQCSAEGRSTKYSTARKRIHRFWCCLVILVPGVARCTPCQSASKSWLDLSPFGSNARTLQMTEDRQTTLWQCRLIGLPAMSRQKQHFKALYHRVLTILGMSAYVDQSSSTWPWEWPWSSEACALKSPLKCWILRIIDLWKFA